MMIVSIAKATEAADVLAVALEGLTADALGKAYRSKAKECHPDHHGKDQLQLWARVSWAKECLECWLKHHPPEEAEPAEPQGAGNCRACNGTGRVVVPRAAHFGATLTMLCVMCRGMGEVIPEEIDND